MYVSIHFVIIKNGSVRDYIVISEKNTSRSKITEMTYEKPKRVSLSYNLLIEKSRKDIR